MRTFINTIMTSVFAVTGNAVVVAVNDKRNAKRGSLRQTRTHRYLSMCSAAAMQSFDILVDAMQTLAGKMVGASVLITGTDGSERSGSDRWQHQMLHLNRKPVIAHYRISSPSLGTVAQS